MKAITIKIIIQHPAFNTQNSTIKIHTMSIHINAKPMQIAPVVLMPGDPLRAKYIAEKWLSSCELVSQTRNNFYYTGNYNGKRLSIGASGMGNTFDGHL